ncbi:dihydrofolate reductase family protein [Umezawaea sp. Da 62-37]|uniref:dihydrofolate reductase family protein n=1 Tax=Umezawaea sp. Da 62-37 TaxID=3075927 RepID=UPI0028F6EABA|nr:dihydrofolate reductase family protein [Umezawaea sp. Da 62-37]WNV84562.1 dihydrofolate reductase family protein [Umezawaea sp. Da 62-37]
MRKIVMYMQSTLNGYGADPGDEMFWARVSDQTWDFTNELHETCDTLVFGRKMYQDFLGFWPGMAKDESDSEVARHARWQYDLAKYVVSTTLTEADPAWPNTRIVSSLDDIAALKDQPGKDILIGGGIDITKSFAAAGLIDDFYIHVNPTTISEGTVLLDARLDLKLVDVKQHDTGALALHYTKG